MQICVDICKMIEKCVLSFCDLSHLARYCVHMVVASSKVGQVLYLMYLVNTIFVVK